VFAGCFRHGAPLAAERVLAPADLAAWADAIAGGVRIAYAGDAIVAFPDLGGDWLAARTPSGRAVAERARAGAHVDIIREGVPTYIRPSEAEVMYPDGVPGALRKR